MLDGQLLCACNSYNYFPESDFSANTQFQLAHYDFKLEKSRLVRSICNNGAAFAIAANDKNRFLNTKL